MAKYTLANIVEMGKPKSFNQDQAILAGRRIKEKNYSIAKEGLFDFFRKKKEQDDPKESKKDLYMEPSDYLEELKQGSKVSIHLQTQSVDDEIKFLEDLIRHGIPLFKKDIERMNKCYKFVLANGQKTLDKLSNLIDISYLDSSYKYNDAIKAIEFDTFVVTVHNFAGTKEMQAKIGSNGDLLGLRETPRFTQKYGSDLSDEELHRYEMMYFLDEAIPNLDTIVPKKKAGATQTRVYLEQSDPKLEKLLKLNMELIEKSYSIIDDDKFDAVFDLISDADAKSHPLDIGDDYGLMAIWAHSNGYQSDMNHGFKQNFIKNYTAH